MSKCALSSELLVFTKRDILYALISIERRSEGRTSFHYLVK